MAGQRRAINGEAVVHRRDLDLAGREILHRVIGAVMALMHFHGLGADREAKHLVAEADAEYRLLLDQGADHRHRIVAGGGRVARAVGEENAVGLERQNIDRGGRRRHHRDLAGIAGELAQNVALDAVIDRDDVKVGAVLPAIALAPAPWRFIPSETLAGRHHRHQIHANEPRPGLGLALERVEIEAAGRLMSNDRIGHAFLPNECGERARIDAGEPDHATALEPLIEMPRRPVIRRRGDGRVQHHPARTGRRREIDCLDVLVVGADIADMGEGEGDDLAGIGRIGEDLLVAGHRGIEADLADGVAGGAQPKAFQHGAVGKNEQRGRLGVVPKVGTVMDIAMGIAMGLCPLRRWRVRQARAGHWCPCHWFALMVASYWPLSCVLCIGTQPPLAVGHGLISPAKPLSAGGLRPLRGLVNKSKEREREIRAYNRARTKTCCATTSTAP